MWGDGGFELSVMSLEVACAECGEGGAGRVV